MKTTRSALSLGIATFAAAAFSTACGEAGPSKPTGPHVQPEIGVGQIGTIAGTGERATDPVDGDANGEVDPPIPALDAKLDQPMDVAFDKDGQLFVIDWNGHKIRKMDAKGDLDFVVGTGKEGDACEGTAVDGKCPAANTELNHPTDIIFDSGGRLVISAWHNAKIKRLDMATGLVENVCGTGNRKFEGEGMVCRDDTGKDQVSFDLPSSVAFDEVGNLFISDQANQVIRRIGAADGIVKVVAGNCPGTPGFGCTAGRGYSGDDGPATLAHISNNLGQGTDPQGKIAYDPKEHSLYIADTGNNVVRKVVAGADGIIGEGDPEEETITTVAGTGTAGFSGDGGPATKAQLSSPTDVAIAADGTLFIADRSNSCVRRVAPDGTISTAAGQCGSVGNAGDGQSATEPGLRTPYGVALDGKGGLYIADTRNQCIRKVVLSE
jgi:sugar lactone lactonase YvrE